MGNPKKNDRVDVWELHAAIISILSTHRRTKKERREERSIFSDVLFESFRRAQFPRSCTRIEICPRYPNWKRLLHDRFPILDPSVYVTRPLDFPHRRDNLSERAKKQARVLASVRNGFATRRHGAVRRRAALWRGISVPCYDRTSPKLKTLVYVNNRGETSDQLSPDECCREQKWRHGDNNDENIRRRTRSSAKVESLKGFASLMPASGKRVYVRGEMRLAQNWILRVWRKRRQQRLTYRFHLPPYFCREGSAVAYRWIIVALCCRAFNGDVWLGGRR